jgi:putative copper export protein
MYEAFLACRLIHFISAMMVFGGGAFSLYAFGAGDARFSHQRSCNLASPPLERFPIRLHSQRF